MSTPTEDPRSPAHPSINRGPSLNSLKRTFSNLSLSSSQTSYHVKRHRLDNLTSLEVNEDTMQHSLADQGFDQRKRRVFEQGKDPGTPFGTGSQFGITDPQFGTTVDVFKLFGGQGMVQFQGTDPFEPFGGGQIQGTVSFRPYGGPTQGTSSQRGPTLDPLKPFGASLKQGTDQFRSVGRPIEGAGPFKMFGGGSIQSTDPFKPFDEPSSQRSTTVDPFKLLGGPSSQPGTTMDPFKPFGGPDTDTQRGPTVDPFQPLDGPSSQPGTTVDPYKFGGIQGAGPFQKVFAKPRLTAPLGHQISRLLRPGCYQQLHGSTSRHPIRKWMQVARKTLSRNHYAELIAKITGPSEIFVPGPDHSDTLSVESVGAGRSDSSS